MKHRSTPAIVVIDPAFDLRYCGYVVTGFTELVGRQNVRFESLGDLSIEDRNPQILRARIHRRGLTRSVAVDLRDRSELSHPLVELVDLYAKTNLDATDDTGNRLAIGPTFGVSTSRRSRIQAFLRSAGTSADRLSQRATLNAYRPASGQDDYVFFIAWPWSKHSDVNVDRATLIEAMRDLRGITFEGGFVPIGRLTRRRPVDGLADLTAPRQYRHGDYLRRLRRSAFAVNTPAVHDCLGWKLGEFLALGKAVISLPLTRVMPGTFEHGEQAHFIAATAQAAAAMRSLLDDAAYRLHLEQGARRYWEDYLAPGALVRRVLAHAFADDSLLAAPSRA